MAAGEDVVKDMVKVMIKAAALYEYLLITYVHY